MTTAIGPTTRRKVPAEVGVFMALVLITIVFELLNRWKGGSFLFNTRDNLDTVFNQARLQIIILQVSITGIIAIGVTQVIILGGIDLSSGSIVGATAMIAMSFAQTAIVNGNPNPKAIFGPEFMDLPVLIPLVVGLAFGLFAGALNGLLIAYTRIPPFIATLGMMVSVRGVSKWWSNGDPVSFPTESFAAISNGDFLGWVTGGFRGQEMVEDQMVWVSSLLPAQGLNPVLMFIAIACLFQFLLSYTLYGKRCYAIGSNEEAARISGINVTRHKVLVYAIAGGLASFAALLLSSKTLTAQAGMGLAYELDAIAMAVIGGVSLSGGRGSIFGTVIGALIFGVIISGFTSIQLDAYYQEMVKGAIIVGAVVLDQWRLRRQATRS